MKAHLSPSALRGLCVCALAFASVGCASTTPYLDSQFGKAFTALKAQQTLNPGAPSASDPGVGVDAQAIKSGYDNYQKSFKAPEPQPSIFLGIGGAGGAR
jgi:hypothetical protein